LGASPSRFVREEFQVIGPYRTLRELGRGGQAIVWLAEDTRIQRQVALKVLPHLGPGGEEALKRFRREAEVASRLEHPGICGLLEADLDHGVPYIAMRYVPGETLAKRLSNARAAGEPPPDRVSLRELALVFEKCSRALHAAHESGIIHRDVKPANIMLTPEGEPVILDFGLARQDDRAAQQLSVSGEASGTPAYMSPEQMTGRARPDRRTDIWSLGIALHECATLRHPFEAATREGLLQSILMEEPSDPRRANPHIDRNFATILETSTAKERDRRYQSALDLAEDLRRWRENEPIRARPVSRVERAQRWVQRNPALAGSGAAIVVLVISAIALLAYGVGAADKVKVETQLRAVADVARQRAEAESRRADEARAALEQVEIDRRFAAELDDLSMQMGTFLYGLQDPKSAAAVLPGYMDAFKRFGIDLAQPDSAKSAPARVAAFRERNPDLWTGVRESIGNLAWLLTREDAQAGESVRAEILALLAALPRKPWPELEHAERRWAEAKVDEFDALLTDEVLQRQGIDELSHLADALFAVDNRLPSVERVLEYALRKDPSSFRFHFLAGSLGFMSAFPVKEKDPKEFEARVAKILHHMQVAVTLRPRSGFMRAMLASALAMKGDYPESMRYIEEATELEPKNAVVWLFKARWYGYAQMWDRSMAACKTALELDPNLVGAREMLADLELKTK
jgi:serine/threonine-protein kinase